MLHIYLGISVLPKRRDGCSTSGLNFFIQMAKKVIYQEYHVHSQLFNIMTQFTHSFLSNSQVRPVACGESLLNTDSLSLSGKPKQFSRAAKVCQNTEMNSERVLETLFSVEVFLSLFLPLLQKHLAILQVPFLHFQVAQLTHLNITTLKSRIPMEVFLRNAGIYHFSFINSQPEASPHVL